MSYEVVLRPTQARAKVRNPWGVLGLSVVTLGIYAIFWWYFINREMRDLGRARAARDLGDSPGLSVAAYWLGSYILIPYIWTAVTTCKRIRTAQRLVGREDLLNGWIAGLLWVFTLGLGAYVYLQHHLDKVWKSDEIEALQTSPSQANPPHAPNQDLDRIEKLDQLRSSGAITDEQFEAERAQILGEPGS
jgi:hypothetical protein